MYVVNLYLLRLQRGVPSTKSSIRYATSFLNADAPMALLHVNGQFIDCNTAFSMLSGYRRDEIPSISLFRITSSRHLTQLFNIVASLLSHANDKTSRSAVHHFPLQLTFKTSNWNCFVCMWLVLGSEHAAQQFQLVVLNGDEEGCPSKLNETAGVVVAKTEEVKEGRTIISDTRPHTRVGVIV